MVLEYKKEHNLRQTYDKLKKMRSNETTGQYVRLFSFACYSEWIIKQRICIYKYREACQGCP